MDSSLFHLINQPLLGQFIYKRYYVKNSVYVIYVDLMTNRHFISFQSPDVGYKCLLHTTQLCAGCPGVRSATQRQCQEPGKSPTAHARSKTSKGRLFFNNNKCIYLNVFILQQKP